MDNTIRYDYASNYDALDAIQSTLNDAHALRDQVEKVFGVLSTVYEGQAADALQQRHQQVSSMMDGIIQDIAATRSGGNQQQEDAHALDAHLAGNF
jgi:uncharacterized protein YukE